MAFTLIGDKGKPQGQVATISGWGELQEASSGVGGVLGKFLATGQTDAPQDVARQIEKTQLSSPSAQKTLRNLGKMLGKETGPVAISSQ